MVRPPLPPPLVSVLPAFGDRIPFNLLSRQSIFQRVMSSATDTKTEPTAQRRSKRKIAAIQTPTQTQSAESQSEPESAQSVAVDQKTDSKRAKSKSKSKSPAKTKTPPKPKKKSSAAAAASDSDSDDAEEKKPKKKSVTVRKESKESADAKANPLFPESAAEMHAWLRDNHKTCKEKWFVTCSRKWPHAKTQPHRLLKLIDIVLCWGWIDSRTKRVDDTRYMMRMTPRRNTENWSAVNRAKVLALIATGEMTESGRAVFSEDMLADPQFNLKGSSGGSGGDSGGGGGGADDHSGGGGEPAVKKPNSQSQIEITQTEIQQSN